MSSTSLGFWWEEERRRRRIDSFFEVPFAMFFESSHFLFSSSFWVQTNLRVLCVLCWILLVPLWRLYRKMRPISQEKEQNIVALIEKGRSSREIAKSVGLAQSIVNRMRERLSTHVALSKEGRPQVLTKWEKRYASRLVIVGDLETAT